MKAGPLTTMLTLYRPVLGQGLRAAAAAAWEEAGRLRAERIRLDARALSENAEAWADYSPTYRIRLSRRPVKEGWRLRERGDERVYVINSIITDRAPGMMTLVCGRVNL